MRYYFMDEYVKKFINHNKNFFNFKKSYKKKKILVEFNGWPPFHLSNSYLISVLKEKSNAEVVVYQNQDLLLKNRKNFYGNLKSIFAKVLKSKTYKIYESIGANSFLKVKYDKFIINDAKKNFFHILESLKSLKDLENLEVNGILIGDLIYDSYLKKETISSIDLNSQKFKIFLLDFLKEFYFWKNYFKKNTVVAVSASHGVYSLAIPLRFSLKFKIDSFCLNEFKIYNFKNLPKIKNINPTGLFLENFLFKKKIKNLNNSEKKKIIKIGKSIAQNKLKNNFNNFYTRKKIFKKKISKQNNKPGILILSHSFFDSPHVFGNNLFTDFKNWLVYLGNLSLKTQNKFNWYIKPHPNQFDLNTSELRKFNSKYKNIKLINKNCSFNDYKKINIRTILTVYGTAAQEGFWHNIVVINASRVHRYSNFDFSLTPKNLMEYKDMIVNNKKYAKKLFSREKMRDLYIYNYMEEVYFNKNYLFPNFQKYIFTKKNRHQIYKSKFYDDWIKIFNYNLHKDIMKRLTKFVNSNDYTTNLTYF